MHSAKALLYYIFILIQMCTALAAPNKADLAHSTEAVHDLPVDTPFVKSKADGQINRRQDQASKIGIRNYFQTNCSGNVVSTVDDVTQAYDTTYWHKPGWSSFQLLYRGLQGQEQLDISIINPENGDPCGNFIDSYFAGTSTSCNNWGNFTCWRLWKNPGL